MKFTCEREQLIEAVSSASRAVSTKSTIEAMEGILIRAMDGYITVTGYDMDTGIETAVEARVDEPGSIVLNARTLGEVVRRLPDNIISASTDAKQVTTIKSGASESALMGIDAESYPALPKVEAQTNIHISIDSLRNIVKRTSFAVAVNDTNPILTGVLIKVKGEDLIAVAVDRFRLGLSREKLLTSIDVEKAFVVPGKALAEIGKLIGGWNEKIVLSVSEKHLMINRGNLNFVCRLLEGDFINYESVIPQTHQTTAIVNTVQLIDSIERASVVINEKLRSPVFLKFEDNRLGVFCASALGKVRDSINAQIEGASCNLSVNNRYMLDALKACDTESVEIKLLSPLSPILIEPLEGSEFTFLVVPTNSGRAAEQN